MAAPTNIAIPTLQSLGDLTKEDDQMIISIPNWCEAATEKECTSTNPNRRNS
jgi:hypothetical protein